MLGDGRGHSRVGGKVGFFFHGGGLVGQDTGHCMRKLRGTASVNGIGGVAWGGGDNCPSVSHSYGSKIFFRSSQGGYINRYAELLCIGVVTKITSGRRLGSQSHE